jgi:hypothetical protein
VRQRLLEIQPKVEIVRYRVLYALHLFMYVCMYMCIYMCICMCVCVCVCVCRVKGPYKHKNTHVSECVCVCVCVVGERVEHTPNLVIHEAV